MRELIKLFLELKNHLAGFSQLAAWVKRIQFVLGTVDLHPNSSSSPVMGSSSQDTLNRYVRISMMLIGCLLTSVVVAQDFTNSNALLTIDNATLTVHGELDNSGELENNGNLVVHNNVSNNGQYLSENGQLDLAGNVDQTIVGIDSIVNLVISGGSDKHFHDSTFITGGLRLEQGYVIMSDSGVVVLLDSAEVQGGSDDAYVIGQLMRSGFGELFFPIGSETEYLPVTLHEVDGESPLVGLEAISELPSNGVGGDLDHVSQFNYWYLHRTPGYASGYVSLPYLDENFVEDINRLVVAQAVFATSDFHTLGASAVDGDTYTGRIRSSGIANGLVLAVGYQEDNSLPPIRVINTVTPYQDGKHDFLRIENIEMYNNNIVEIFNRAGAKVFYMKNYDNQTNVFRGLANQGPARELQDGNYFYTIRAGKKKLGTGFIFLKR